MKVLLTGFEPFEGDEYNVSGQIAQSLDGQRIKAPRVSAQDQKGQQASGATRPGVGDIHGVVLPVERYTAVERLREQIQQKSPALVICLGYASAADSIRLERVAVNIDDFRIPDNAGNQPLDEPIFAEAPLAYRASLPVKRCVQAVQAAQIPAQVSDSAGTYLCNHIFFGALHLSYTMKSPPQGSAFRTGFIHIPADEQQRTGANDQRPFIEFSRQVQAMRLILETCLVHTDDVIVGNLGRPYE